MFESVAFQICSLFYISVLIIVYFSKNRLKTVENKIYVALLLSNAVGLILDIASVFTIKNMESIPFINIIVTKSYLIYLLTWIMLMTVYIFIITKSRDNMTDAEEKSYTEKIFVNTGILYGISAMIIMLLKLSYISNNDHIYSFGPSADFLYLVSGICMAIWCVKIAFNFKTVKKIKYLPIVAYIILGGVATMVQNVWPNILLITSMESFITLFMYFTIENPDLKLINELNIAKEQAIHANNSKSDFLSNMSHEIRTPLHAIVGFSEALAEDNEVPESAKSEVEDIKAASKTLLELVNGILDISKIEANKLEIINSEYSTERMLAEVISLTKARLGAKDVNFNVYVDPSLPDYLNGDISRLKQIMINLLTNSVKYTDEGEINFNINTIQKGGVCTLIISVEDTGKGIKEEDIEKLFNKFERINEGNTSVEGTGLGLAITKKLVELMNGQIVVHSTFGEGSKFTVKINQVMVDRIAPPKEVIKELEKSIEETQYTDKKVILIDDNKLNLKVAVRLLKLYGIDAETVSSGFEFIENLKSGKIYDLVLLDDMMPEMTGVETLHKIKEEFDYSMPTVALTANAIEGMREKYLKEGFDDYLAKPIDRSELNRVIYKYLSDK